MKIIAPICSLTIYGPKVGLLKIQESISTAFFGPGHVTCHITLKFKRNKPTRAMYQFTSSLTTYQIHDALQYTQVRTFRK